MINITPETVPKYRSVVQSRDPCAGKIPENAFTWYKKKKKKYIQTRCIKTDGSEILADTHLKVDPRCVDTIVVLFVFLNAILVSFQTSSNVSNLPRTWSSFQVRRQTHR